jgi:hypothetical protein
MDPPDLEAQDAADLGGRPPDPAGGGSATLPDDDDPGVGWLEEVVARLEADPDERWPAVESLSAFDAETRRQVVEALAGYRDRPGVRDLLDLLGSARDLGIRAVAARAIPAEGSTSLPAVRADRDGGDLRGPADAPDGRIVRSVVTAIDWDGRAIVVVSARVREYRRTAAFRADVRRGILDVVGEIERDDSSAGRLFDHCVVQSEGRCAVDVHELAVRLLAGCRLLNGPDVPATVRIWLDATIGPDVAALGRPGAFRGPDPGMIPDGELPERAAAILDACPGWLDRSALTFEMAAEIALREGDAPPDPVRDAGAYRYLFEHRLSDRLELLARMLLWMGWVWHASGLGELSRSAFVLGGQLADEQYAVPSHPFTVALSTRSLRAAQERLLERP